MTGLSSSLSRIKNRSEPVKRVTICYKQFDSIAYHYTVENVTTSALHNITHVLQSIDFLAVWFHRLVIVETP